MNRTEMLVAKSDQKRVDRGAVGGVNVGLEAAVLCEIMRARILEVEPALSVRGLDADRLWGLAKLHRAELFIPRALLAEGQGKGRARDFDDARRRAALSTGAALASLRDLWPLIARAGIRAAVFKGPTFQKQVYGDFLIRRSGDIDLLVDRVNFARVRDLISTQGWSLAPSCESIWWEAFLAEQHFLSPPHRATVDLHYRVQQPGCPPPLDHDALFESLEQIDVGGCKVSTLSLTNAALVSAMSLAKALLHREPALRHVMDLAALSFGPYAQRADYLERARAQGLEQTLALGWCAVERCFGLVTPEAPPLKRFPSAMRLHLPLMIIEPTNAQIRWPKRIGLLWMLVDSIGSFPGEAVRKSASDAVRAALDH